MATLTRIVGTHREVFLCVVGLGGQLRRAGYQSRRAGGALEARPRVLAGIGLALAVVATPAGTSGQLPVIDAANLVQTTLTALEAIQSVINEVQMIENQVKQVETMLQNTRNYGQGIWDTQALPRLLRLGQVIDQEQEQAIAYTMVNVDSLFRQRYPGYRPVTDWSRTYDSWASTTLDTLGGVLNSAGLQGAEFATEQGRIQALQALSDSAAGRMQALQVGNMMAARRAGPRQARCWRKKASVRRQASSAAALL